MGIAKPPKREPHTAAGQLAVAEAAIDASPDLIFWADADGRIVYANRAACETLAYERAELLNLRIADVAAESAHGDWPGRWQAFKNAGLVTREAELRSRTGRRINVEVKARFLVHGGCEYVSASAREITEQKRAQREHEESRAQFEAIFQESPTAIVITRLADGVILEANAAFERVYGYRREELIGHTTLELELFGPEDRAQLLAALATDQGVHDLPMRTRHKDGRALNTSSSVTLFSFQGQRCLLCMVVDVTANQAQARELREREERLRAIVDTSQAGIILVDRLGIITFANRGMAEMFGCAVEQLIGTPYTSHVHPDQRQIGDDRMRKLIAGEVEGVYTERHYQRADGGSFWGYLGGRRYVDTDGRFVALVGVIVDVTARRHAEEELRASEEKFATVFRRAPVLMGISTVDDGTMLDVNDKFCEMVGYTREELVGKTSTEIGLLTPTGRAELLAEFKRNGRSAERELMLIGKGGRPVPCLWCLEPITVDGQPRLLVIAQDLSEVLRLQEEVLRTQKLESLGLLAGGLAHDFNNVMTGVLGNLSFARMLVGEQHEAAQSLADCEKAALRASEMTRQLLTFSRGGAPTRKVFEPKRLIEEAVSFALRGSNVKAVLELAADLWCLYADEGQIAQVLANLLINAKQAMPAGGTVTVRAANEVVDERRGAALVPVSYVRIEVADTGAGIAPELLGKVFDPYFTTKPGGTGLGLSSVHSIVKRHGGRVEVASAQQAGTTFTLHLPAAPSAAPPATADASAAAAAPTGHGRILIMDDEPLIRGLASRTLAALGYEPVPAADGATAVSAFREAREQGAPFRAVLLDLTVPGGMGGKEAAARILEIDPAAVLVVSTGYSNDPIMSDFQAYGFAGAVAKPYVASALAAEMTRLLADGPQG